MSYLQVPGAASRRTDSQYRGGQRHHLTAASRSEIEKATLAQLTKAAQAQKDSTSAVVGATNTTTKMARANSFAAATAVANKDVEMAAAIMGSSAQKHQ